MLRILAVDLKEDSLAEIEALSENIFSDCVFLKASSQTDEMEKTLDQSPDLILLGMDSNFMFECMKSGKWSSDLPVIIPVSSVTDTVKKLKKIKAFFKEKGEETLRRENENKGILKNTKNAEIALRESNERFRQLAENIAEVFWVASPDWQKFHYVSPAYEKVWGVSSNYLYENPSSWIDSVFDEDREKLKNLLAEAIADDYTDVIFPEYRIIRSDGAIRWISSRGYPVRNEDGIVYRVVGISEDITDTRHSEKAFHAILEGTVGAIGQDLFDRIVIELSDWLDCELALIGEIESSKIKALSMLLDNAIINDIIYDIKDTPSEILINEGFSAYSENVAVLFPQDEGLKKVEAEGYVGTSLKDMNGQITGVLIAVSRRKLILPEHAEGVMNILAARISAEVERKRVEAEKIKMEAQLRQAQKMEAIGTLAGGIAHDFNNILQSIMLNAELAIFESSADDQGQYRMEEVLKSSKRATDLVKQILTFSRQSEVELKPLNAGLVIKEALKMLRSSLPSTIEMVSNVSSGVDPVMADPTQIHQVVMNLCTNAAHAMKEEGGFLTVDLGHFDLSEEKLNEYPDIAPGPYLKICVSDTGCGIDDDTIDRIFDPFFTTKKRDEGTGLGLAVVYGIVKELGGAVKVGSEKGKGSKFTILLPRIEKVLTPQKKETSQIPGGSETMLIVDDEIELINLQRSIFERLGYHVETRSGSIEALECFMKNPDMFDIIITDQTMPKMTGIQLAGECMKIRPDIPVILCTGFSDIISEEDVKLMGIREFVMKPIVIRDIAERVRAILDSVKK